MDSYNNNSIANRRIYDLNMEELKEKMLENKKQFLRKRKGFWEKARSYND